MKSGSSHAIIYALEIILDYRPTHTYQKESSKSEDTLSSEKPILKDNRKKAFSQSATKITKNIIKNAIII